MCNSSSTVWSRSRATFASSDDDGEGGTDGLTLYQCFFEINETLCRRYPALTPFIVRRERAGEVFRLMRRINSHPRKTAAEKEPEKDAQGRILIPAGDDWF